MIDKRTSGKVATAFALSILVAGPGSSAPAMAKGAIVNLKQDMTSTGADQDARGRLRFVLKTDADGRLVIRGGRLSPDATFDVLANGIKVGTLATTGGGGGRLRLRSNPRTRDGLLGFDPRGTSIVVRDEEGDDVLAAMVADDSIEPGKIACCIPDDSGPECEDRTEDECVAQGGSVTTASTCLPNPCEGAPAPDDDDVVCCIPDDSGPECEDRTISECAAEGGTVVDATSCAPNPCAGTPPAEGEIACCVPHDTPGEPDECETETPATCSALGGTATSATSCLPDPCGDGGNPPGDDDGDEIACCVPHDTPGEPDECETETPAECAARGGTPTTATSCAPDLCGPGSDGDDDDSGDDDSGSGSSDDD